MEVHIFPIKMRTVLIDKEKCDAQDENCVDCPVLDMLRREKETE